jgi:hypothetical protein
MSEHPVHQVGADSGRGLLPKLLADGVGGILLFGITPPRSSATPDQVREIAAVTLARLEPLDLDGLVLYDIDDESDRNAQERPFPYLPTLDPAQFHDEYLRGWGRPAIIYRCVGKYPQDRLADWLRSADAANILTVFVGPSSREKPVYTRLDTAHALRSEIQPGMMLGGVAITHAPSGGWCRVRSSSPCRCADHSRHWHSCGGSGCAYRAGSRTPWSTRRIRSPSRSNNAWPVRVT